MANLAVYAFWVFVPVLFILMSFWAFLSSRKKPNEIKVAKDFLRQSGFLFLGAGVSFVVDYLATDKILDIIGRDSFPDWFVRMFIFPFVLFAMAKFIGPAEKILVIKPPKPTEVYKSWRK